MEDREHGRVSAHRLGLLGGESTGKTTLALDLADALPGFIAEEYLRDFVRDFGRLPRAADQEGIYLTQAATVRTVERAADYAEVPWVIADPLPLMTAVYSIVYFDDDSLLTQGLEDALTYDVVLWCAPDIPWIAEEGMRDGIDYRDRAEAVLSEYVAPVLGPTGRLHRVTGDAALRHAAALDVITAR